MPDEKTDKTIDRYVSQFDMASFLNEDLLRSLRLFHFPAFSNIYIEGNEQHYFYFLVEGQVQFNHYHWNSRVVVFALGKPFAAMGDLEIFTERRLGSNVIATEDTIMLGITTTAVDRYGADDLRFLHFLIEQLRDKIFKITHLQTNHLLPVINQLAAYILMQAEHVKNDVIFLPGKEELASLLRTTPRHLNRVLKELVSDGAISTDYPLVHILNRQALSALGS